MNDFRTKPTVEAGITINESNGDINFVEYQPGNGTRYQLLIVDTTKLGEKANFALGADGGAVVVSFPLGGYKTITLCLGGGYLSRDYVAEKIGSSSLSDVAVLTELLAYLTDRRAESAGP